MSEPDPANGHLETVAIVRIAFVATAAIVVGLHLWQPDAGVSPIGIAATLIGGYPIFRTASLSLFERRMTMELSMTIALGAALFIGETFTALVIIVFVLVAEELERLTVHRGRRSISDLLAGLPRAVTIRNVAGLQEHRSVEELRSGDLVVVAPGELIPVDGNVVGGHSYVDQARITGESLPAEKFVGAAVYAGTINQSGSLDVRVERVGRDTTYGKIVDAIEAAEASRAPIQRLADQLAGYLVYFALGCAALTFLLTRDVRATISVIIVAGACGIAAGTPLAILGAIGRSAREGAIVKGGRFLEVLARIDTVVLDKTGTLTYGTPDVVGVHCAPGTSEHQLLEAAAIAERRSEHPFGKAIVRRADALGIAATEPDSFAYTPGLGVSAAVGRRAIHIGNRALLAAHGIQQTGESSYTVDGTTAVFVAEGTHYLGAITISDTLRPEAIAAVDELHRMRIRTLLLSGDTAAATRAIAQQLRVDEFAADLLPTDKLERVTSLVRDGRCVAMVGDGVNDAPALARADVGVAMGSGTDIAQESADVVLLGNDLAKFVATIRIARRARRIIMQNFVGTLVVDAAGIVLAAISILNPLLAAFVHVASELIFILNSTRMLPRRLPAFAVTRES